MRERESGGPGEEGGGNQSINLQDMKLSPSCIICYNFCYKLKQSLMDGSATPPLANSNEIFSIINQYPSIEEFWQKILEKS